MMISGVRLRVDSDPLDDSYDDYIEKKQNSKTEPSTDLVTAMTAFSEKSEISEFTPKPPTIDRSIHKQIEVNPYFKYQMTGNRVDWLELTFHSERTANKWDKCLSIVFSAQTRKPHKIGRKDAEMWLLSIKGVTLAQIKQLEAMDLDKAPELIHR
jgi:hypothetical protein